MFTKESKNSAPLTPEPNEMEQWVQDSGQMGGTGGIIFLLSEFDFG